VEGSLGLTLNTSNWVFIMHSKIVIILSYFVSAFQLIITLITRYCPLFCFVLSFQFFLQLLCISLVFVTYWVSIILLKLCLKKPYSAGRMLASKITYSAWNSAGRIYPSLFRMRENFHCEYHWQFFPLPLSSTLLCCRKKSLMKYQPFQTTLIEGRGILFVFPGREIKRIPCCS